MKHFSLSLAKDGSSSRSYWKGTPFHNILHSGGIAMVLALIFVVSPRSLHGGLVYWGSQGFVENANSHSHAWTTDFAIVLGVFSKDFVPLPANREQWSANWIELSKAEFDPEEARFSGVADLSTKLPANTDSQVYMWASNGSDLTKGPEWLLMTRPDWKWPSTSSPQDPAIVWTTGNNESVVLGAVCLNGCHLLTSRVTPIPIPQQTWLQSFFPNAITAVDPAVDSDGDGLSNQLEYYLGTNPNDGSSMASPQIVTSEDATVVNLKRNPFADSQCVMETSSDLITWVRSFAEVIEDRPDLIQMKIVRNPAEKAAFFRFNFKSHE
jgi:Bacterial TSP3 repeat